MMPKPVENLLLWHGGYPIVVRKGGYEKIFLSSCAFVFMCTIGWTQKYSFQNLVGRWEATDGSDIEAIDSTKIFLGYGADKKVIISFKADFTKFPCWFDFEVKDNAKPSI